MKAEYTIILFYNYVRIEDPVALMHEQRALCEKLGLKGRIIIAHEGVNVTLEGATEATETYYAALIADPRFADTHIKRSAGTGKAFPKLSVKVRKEIVSLGLSAKNDINPREVSGKYLSAEEFHELLNKKEKGTGKPDDDFVVIDMRNDYEHRSGHFKGSILPPLHNFRDIPKVLPTLEHLKDKKIVTVCTGGVRCEKASGFLVKNGFKNVYQLHGGIVTYMEKYENAAVSEPAKNFIGSLYVFDDRVTMAFAEAGKGTGQRPLVGTCELCAVPSEKYINCANNDCHRHFIVCDKCVSGDSSNNVLCSLCR